MRKERRYRHISSGDGILGSFTSVIVISRLWMLSLVCGRFQGKDKFTLLGKFLAQDDRIQLENLTIRPGCDCFSVQSNHV